MVRPNPSVALGVIDEYSFAAPKRTGGLAENATNAGQAVDDDKYEWSEELQGWILGSFYIGYM